MVERVAERLVSSMLASQAIPEENAELVSFGIVQGLRSVIEIIVMVVTGLVLGRFWQSMVILLVFMPLRIYAGGYHAKTPMQCAIKTWLLFLGILLWLKFVPFPLWGQILFMIITVICLWRFAPVQHENRPLEEYEIVKYRKKAFQIFGVETALFVALSLFGFAELAKCIVLGIVMMTVIMVLGVLVERMKRYDIISFRMIRKRVGVK